MRDFVRSAQSGDLVAFCDALDPVEELGCWQPAFRALVKGGIVHPELRARFPAWWAEGGDGTRQAVDNDGLLFDALRLLMPPYKGPSLTLYRGDGWRNRCRRTYGPSWSKRKKVAEAYAQGNWQTTIDGSVLLETLAPAEAIICALHKHENRRGEDEYVVDRRRLRQVRVVKRYVQRPVALSSRPFLATSPFS